MDQSLLFERVKDADEAIVHRNHETRREQLQLEPRVHQGRTVRQEFETGHDAKETPRRFLDLDFVRAVVTLGLREVPGDPGEKLPRSLDDLSLFVFLQVPFLENT